ncbi:MAG TPA: phospholipid carrier-dependent glycosyltransferase, partial [Frankiaceae bacterium]|nr:phospholipid carrier-dependent glycosyltransferase [Frankiaceae bacterium]
DRLADWLMPLAVTAVAGVLRFWHLTAPRGMYFDEVYYTRDAYGLLTRGYELNDRCTGGAFVVHPPLGKWLIALSEWAFGHVDCTKVAHGNPELGWRFSSAVAGTLAVLVLARTARRMFRSTVLGCFAGLLLALDGLEFVQSRIGILDVFLMTWIVLALGCLVRDRDWGRERLAAAAGRSDAAPGPWPGARPWRLACGVCLGAAMATKWSALYTIVGFAALAVAWDVGARRTAGVRAPFRGFLRRDAALWAVAFLVVPVVVYTASWTGWFLTDGGYDRHLYGDGVLAAFRGWWHYHGEIRRFHERLSSPHPYASKPWSWLVLGRPVAYFYSSPKTGELGCHARAGCAREVLALGNPAIWWAGLAALIGTVGLWVSRRDWRASLVVVGFAVSFLPWLLFPSRTMFIFYALPLLPFLVLGITAMAGLVLGPPDAPESRRVGGALVVGVYAILVLVLFVYFYPILAAQVIPVPEWQARMWFPGWV